MLGLGRTTSYDLARTGRFPVRTLRLASKWVVARADLDRYLGLKAEPDLDLSILLDQIVKGATLDRAGVLATLALLSAIGHNAQSQLNRLLKEGQAMNGANKE